MSEIIKKPWGTYQTIVKGKTYQVKKIVVFPNSQLSLQSHNRRSEHWVIVKGQGNVTLEEKQLILKKDDSVYIPVNTKHRMSNFTDKEIIFIEVQNGDYLGEDDIIRYEDIYGRV